VAARAENLLTVTLRARWGFISVAGKMLDWRVMRLGLPAAVLIAVAGCGPIGQSGGDETLEPHFQTGRHRVGAMDYRGAVESFERALEINPRSAAAHFELALLYEDRDKINDPAAAIYHFERFLKLRPGSDRAEIARQKVAICKTDLARSASPLPLSGNQQQEVSRLAAENSQLRRQVEQLQQMLAARPSAVTNYVIGTPTPAPVLPAGTGDLPAPPPLVPPTAAPKNPASTPVAARTHTVKQGESFYSIARRYNVDRKKLQSANPGVNPDRMQIGQTLKIPAP
jgi:LysM repeat protein